jgi:hypothetical protein
MQTVTRDELRELASLDNQTCVTVYVPLHRGFSQAKEDSIRFRDGVDRAEQQLLDEGQRRGTVKKLLKPARELQRDVSFWRSHGADALAVFAAPEFFRSFTLPYECPETAEVGPAFWLAPLMRSLNWDVSFHVMALSEKSLRLLRCNRSGFEPEELPAGMPHSLDEALAGTEVEKSLQVHTAAGFGMGASHVGMAHGQGNPKDYEKKLLVDYFQIVARHAERLLNGRRPLVLAAVDYYHPMFRDACRTLPLLDGGVIGSPDGLTDRDIWLRALPEVDRWQGQAVQHLRDRFGKLAGGERAGADLADIVPAARQGRVETLFAAFGQRVWGHAGPESEPVEVHQERQNGDRDLLDLAAKQALLHRGDVLVVAPEEVPGGKTAAAILRW